MHSSSLGPLHSLPPSTSRSRRPRRPSPPERGSRRSSVFKPGPFPLILMHGCPLYRVPSPGHPCSVGTILLGLSPFLCIPVLANRSYSSGTAEVSTKTVTSWSNALDAHNEDQCGLFDVGAPPLRPVWATRRTERQRAEQARLCLTGGLCHGLYRHHSHIRLP